METLQMEKLKELVISWRDAVTKEGQLLSDVKNIDNVLHEPALKKHMACISDRILTRQCCILELQNLMLVEQAMNLEKNDASERPLDLIVSNRAASIALMLAEVHIGDGDCLGDAARELHAALAGKVEPPTDFDC